MPRSKKPIVEAPTQPQTLQSRILRTPEILARFGISLPTLFRRKREGVFPKGFKLAPHSRLVGWYESEIAAWEAQRQSGVPASPDGQPA